MEETTPALLGCDRDTFAQVWSRVSPGDAGPIEVVPPAGEQTPPPREVPLACPVTIGDPDRDGEALRSQVDACLGDAAAYAGLIGRTRRQGPALRALQRQKTAHARRLSAAYFLLTGVRYWPQARPVDPPEGFFPRLRRQYLAEQERAAELQTLAAQTQDRELRAVYQELARETARLPAVIRGLVVAEV